MGYSIAAAAALVALAALVAAFAVTDTATRSAQQVDAAWRAQQERSLRALRSQAEVTSANSSLGTLTVKATNTGATAIDARQVDLLLAGVPATVATRTVDGAARSVWAPGQELELTVAAGAPAALSLVGPDGILATWRA